MPCDCGIVTDCAVGPPLAAANRDLVRMGVTLLTQSSRPHSFLISGEQYAPPLPCCEGFGPQPALLFCIGPLTPGGVFVYQSSRKRSFPPFIQLGAPLAPLRPQIVWRDDFTTLRSAKWVIRSSNLTCQHVTRHMTSFRMPHTRCTQRQVHG